MLNIDLKIDLKNVPLKPTRDGYGEGLVAAAERDADVVALGADITASTRVDWFKKSFRNVSSAWELPNRIKWV